MNHHIKYVETHMVMYIIFILIYINKKDHTKTLLYTLLFFLTFYILEIFPHQHIQLCLILFNSCLIFHHMDSSLLNTPPPMTDTLAIHTVLSSLVHVLWENLRACM